MPRKLMMALLAIVLTAVLAFFAYNNMRQNAKREAEIAVETFLDAVRQQNTFQALQLLDLPPGQVITLLTAFNTPLIQAGLLQEVHLTSLQEAYATISLNIMGQHQATALDLQYKEGGWIITDFPQVHVLQTAFLTGAQEGRSGRYVYHFQHPEETVEFSSRVLFEPEAGAVVDAVAVQDQLVYLQELPSKALDKILAVDKTALEDIREGVLALSPDLILYDCTRGLEGNESPEIASWSCLLPGMQDLRAFTREGTVVALSLGSTYVPERIRVLLNTSGHQGILHRRVDVTSSSPFALEDLLAGESHSVAAGKILTLKPGEGGVLAVFPNGDEVLLSTRIHMGGRDRLEVTSLERGTGSAKGPPAYRGDLEVSLHGGALILLNELPLEEYLYSVVPSEMPVMFGLEPLKAQAVAARSYAVTSIYNSRFKNLGGHVDDSVSSQVYNNVPEVPLARTAVQQTTGLVAFFGSSIIDARYFSTSSGYTANFHEVWHDPETKEFPSTPVRYLISSPQLVGMDFDITSEERIRDFLDRSDINAYDAVSPFFRWEVTMTREELEAAIEENLAARHRDQPQFILTKEDNRYGSIEIPGEPLGKLEYLRVEERGEGGNLMGLEITGEKGTYLIRKEYNIRFLLRPRQYLSDGEPVVLKRHDGSVLHNYNLLPSAFIYFQINRNEKRDIETVTIRGGGNGHGVGMSQYGAYAMGQRGHDFREILKHYYPKTELWSIYAWQVP